MGALMVGIGTDSPAGLLHINGTGDAIRVESTNTGAGGAQMDLLHFTTSPADNDVHGQINFGGYHSGTTSSYGSAIRSVWTDVSLRKAELQFYARSGGDFEERFTITPDGVDIKRGLKYIQNYTYSSSWTSNKQTVIPTGTLASDSTYLVLLKTDSLGTPPYYAEAAFIFRTAGSTNGTGTNGSYAQITSHHVSSSSYWEVATTTASNSTNGLAARLVNGPTSGGNIGTAQVRIYVTQIQGS